MTRTLLLVDDDPSFREVMRFNLAEPDLGIDVAADAGEALALFARTLHPVVMTDLQMPGMGGLAFMAEIHRRQPATAVIVITAFGDIATAVEAMRAGAFDFIPKPAGREHVRFIIRRAFRQVELESRVRALEAAPGTRDGEILFRSQVMGHLLDLADRVAHSDATVLLSGESGTGKELFARRIHRLSARSDGPFVAVNCGAMPRDLIESELFGHVRGAFTGAARDRKGRFQQASGGTLFLDEVGELPIDLQSRLLRALQERAVDPVGSDDPVPVDTRVVAATNRDLRDAVESGEFREDLYFRLDVVPMTIPPLRDRPEDIGPLVAHFLAKYGGGRTFHVTDELLRVLEGWSWPGNVRELENLCHRLTVLARDERLGAEMLPTEMTSRAVHAKVDGLHIHIPPEGMSLEELERQVIVEALSLNAGNQSAAARFLRIPRHILLHRMAKFGLTR